MSCVWNESDSSETPPSDGAPAPQPASAKSAKPAVTYRILRCVLFMNSSEHGPFAAVLGGPSSKVRASPRFAAFVADSCVLVTNFGARLREGLRKLSRDLRR